MRAIFARIYYHYQRKLRIGRFKACVKYDDDTMVRERRKTSGSDQVDPIQQTTNRTRTRNRHRSAHCTPVREGGRRFRRPTTTNGPVARYYDYNNYYDDDDDDSDGDVQTKEKEPKRTWQIARSPQTNENGPPPRIASKNSENLSFLRTTRFRRQTRPY